MLNSEKQIRKNIEVEKNYKKYNVNVNMVFHLNVGIYV